MFSAAFSIRAACEEMNKLLWLLPGSSPLAGLFCHHEAMSDISILKV